MTDAGARALPLPAASDQDAGVTAAEPSLPPLPVLWRRVPAGRVLAFAPHPDDEVAGPGGVLAMHADQGDAVRVVVATDGTSGDPDGRHAPGAFAALRRRESQDGLRHLGVHDVRFWGFPDGHVLSEADLRNAAALAARELAEHRPDVVYLPWELDGHPDQHPGALILLYRLRHSVHRRNFTPKQADTRRTTSSKPAHQSQRHTATQGQ